MQIKTLSVGALDTNCYLVWDEERRGLVIDPGDEAPRLLRMIEALDLTIDAVLLTHAHFDHMQAAGALCEATDARLLVGAEDAAALADASRNLSGLFGDIQPISLSADRLLCEGDVVTVGSNCLTVWQTPGHTPGSLCLLGDGVVFSGDTLFAGSCGRVDFPGGDGVAMRQSLQRLASLPTDWRVYPGHGLSTQIGQERDTNPYMR
ncbi:MAG: MBL fold metallo-hydrolase [Clostridia bacterium]|nr:MBL fold metallo-hydrolase [Clostridia bacterium]